MGKISIVTMDETLTKLANYETSVMEPLRAPEGLLEAEQIEIYRKMLLIRKFDSSVKDLWKQNYIYGLAHSYVGAEAVAVGACAALRKNDKITSTHRGHGHTIAMGGDIKKMMAELMGKAAGYCQGKGGSMHIAAIDEGMLGATGIVGSGMPIAIGAGLSAKVLNKDYVTICFHGDGGTNQGIWHESINMAAVWDLPVIFLCENNQWAISFPYQKAAKNPNVTDRAIGYGIPGFLVDGFNPFSVYKGVKKAADLARSGKGPSLIEARFYRYIGHFVADDESYRDIETNEPWKKYDPIIRMEHYLKKQLGLSKEHLQELNRSAHEEVQQAITFAKEADEPAKESLNKDIYSPTFMDMMRKKGEYS